MKKICTIFFLCFSITVFAQRSKKVVKVIEQMNASMVKGYCILANDSLEYLKVPTNLLLKFQYSSPEDISDLTDALKNLNEYLSSSSLHWRPQTQYLKYLDAYPEFNSSGYRNAMNFAVKKFAAMDSTKRAEDSLRTARWEAEEKQQAEERRLREVKRAQEEEAQKQAKETEQKREKETGPAYRIWDKYEMDSVTFLRSYGTVTQYQYQKTIEQRSSHKQLCILAGAKAYWLINLAYYLGGEEYQDVELKESDATNEMTITASSKTSSNIPVKVRAPYNSNYQITSVTITGPADDVINIFLGYWELTEMSFNALKSKKSITKEFVSDLVSFTWTGTNPVIKVTKNPRPLMDLFPF